MSDFVDNVISEAVSHPFYTAILSGAVCSTLSLAYAWWEQRKLDNALTLGAPLPHYSNVRVLPVQREAP